MITTTNIAQICHEANRVYCLSQGDESQVHWEIAPDWQKQSAINGVEAILQGRVTTPEESHDNWVRDKVNAGWKCGPVKDADKKEHPCLVPYDMLPVSQRFKDQLFFNIVKTWE